MTKARGLVALLMVFLATAFPAAAQDLTGRPDARSWTGGHLGIVSMRGTARITAQGRLAERLEAVGIARTLFEPEGTVIGLRAGHDWQRGRAVWGLGADYAPGDRTGHLLDGPAFALRRDARVTLSDSARIYGRVGYAAGPWLPYATVGYGTARLAITGFADDTGRVAGLTAGLGIERQLGPRLGLFGEYVYTDLNDIEEMSDRISVDLRDVRLGLTLRF